MADNSPTDAGYAGLKNMRGPMEYERPEGYEKPAGYERIAADIHALNRHREEIFRHQVMADSALNIMLAALITHEQDVMLRRSAAAMASHISMEDAEPIFRQLTEAGLIEVDKMEDKIILTPQGAVRTRHYIQMMAPLMEHYSR